MDQGIFGVPSLHFMVLGAITMKFSMMNHKKMFFVKNFNFFFKFCFYFQNLKCKKDDLIWHVASCFDRPF